MASPRRAKFLKLTICSRKYNAGAPDGRKAGGDSGSGEVILYALNFRRGLRVCAAGPSVTEKYGKRPASSMSFIQFGHFVPQTIHFRDTCLQAESARRQDRRFVRGVGAGGVAIDGRSSRRANFFA